MVVYILTFTNPEVPRGLQALQLAAVTAVASLNLCVVAFLDTPFSGASGSIRSTAMGRTLAEIDGELDQDRTAEPIPCDQSGNPMDASA